MNTFRMIDPHQMSKTPPPQIFSPSHDDWNNQAISEQRYHDPLSEQEVSPWQRDHYSNGHSDGNAGFWKASIGGSVPMQNTPLDDGSSTSSLERSSQYSSPDSYGSSNTSYSQPVTTGSGSIDPRLMQSNSLPEHLYQTPFTGMALVASPDGLAVAASNTTLFHCQSDSPAQDGVYTTHPTGCYFTHTPNHSQYPVRPNQQPASGLQEEEPYPDLNAGSLVSSLPPPLHKHTHHGKEGGAVADHPNPKSNVCGCGAAFGRQTDLERHQKTTKKHNGDQHGLACPVKGCRFTSKFTRDDNFRTHCRRQHGMSVDEVNTYIRWWRSQRMA